MTDPYVGRLTFLEFILVRFQPEILFIIQHQILSQESDVSCCASVSEKRDSVSTGEIAAVVGLKQVQRVIRCAQLMSLFY